MMFFLTVVLLLLVCATLAVLVVQNLTVMVHLSLFSWQSPNLPVGLWIVAGFLLGALLLYFVSMASAWHDHREVKKLYRRIAALEGQKETKTLSSAPVAAVRMRATEPLLSEESIATAHVNG